MSEWGRPDDSVDGPRPNPTFEIPLVGDDPLGDEGGRPETNWRRVIAIAGIGGVALGVAISAIVLSSDGDGDAAPTPTVDTSPALITTPPTLPPATTTTIESVRNLDPKINQPLFPSTGRSPSDVLARFDLEDSLAVLDDDPPNHATIRTTVSTGGAVEESFVEITHDPSTGRDLIRLVEGDGIPAEAVVDRSTGWLYSRSVEPADQPWVRFRPDWLSKAPDDDQHPLDAVRLGPVRSDDLDDAQSIASGELVVVDDVGPPVRRFDVALPVSSVLDLSIFVLGFPSAGPLDPAATDADAAFRVYVSEQPDVRLVTGRVDLEGQPVVIEHHLVRLDDVGPIELPDADEVIDG